MLKTCKLIFAAAATITLSGFAFLHANAQTGDEDVFYETRTGYGDTEERAIDNAKAGACMPGGALGYRATLEDASCRTEEKDGKTQYICQANFRCDPDF